MRGLADLFMHVVCEFRRDVQYVFQAEVFSEVQEFKFYTTGETEAIESIYYMFAEANRCAITGDVDNACVSHRIGSTNNASVNCLSHYDRGCANTKVSFLGAMYCGEFFSFRKTKERIEL